VSDQNNQLPESLELVNDELTRGLKLCHSLVDDYRSKLTTRLNDNAMTSAANDDDLENSDQSDRA
jgi:hypothetical protein